MKSREVRSLNFLVVGDSCTDVFEYHSSDRLAPDLPVPVLSHLHTKKNPGMAANVARNLKALGHEVTLLSPLGWQRHEKKRIVDANSNHTFLRIDSPPPTQALEVVPDCGDYDAVLISDYAKGFLSPITITEITHQHHLVLMDTKRTVGQWAEGVSMLKLNEFEWAASMNTLPPSLEQKTVVTLGDDGARWQGQHFKAIPALTKDATGAGDTFFATFASSFASGAGWAASIEYANLLASQSTSKPGVSVARA